MTPIFKAAEKDDADALLALRRAFCRHEHLSFEEGAARAALDRLLADGSLGRVWLIQLDGAAIGYVVLAFSYSLEFDGRNAFVDELFVEDPYRSQGIGRLALRLVEDACRTLGVHALHLEVNRENHRARSIYEKAGFEDRNNHLLTKRLKS